MGAQAETAGGDDRRPTLLLVSAFEAPPIDDDAVILAGRYRVLRATGGGPGALLRAVSLARSADVVLAWFLSVYGAAAILAGAAAGRRTAVVIGGVDAARCPVPGYGLWSSRWKSALARRALRRAGLVLPVADALRDEIVRLADYGGENVRVLPTGYDPDVWTPDPSPGAARERRALCVAAVDGPARLAIKGIDVLADAARRVPDIPVTVIGVPETLAAPLRPPPSMTLLPAVPRADLLAHYRRAAAYCQPSRREGLPGALCEAMLCGCVPAVTDAGDCAAAVGDTGFTAPPGDPDALAGILRRAIDAPPGSGAKARERIAALYSLDARRKALPELLDSLSGR